MQKRYLQAKHLLARACAPVNAPVREVGEAFAAIGAGLGDRARVLQLKTRLCTLMASL